MRRDSKLSSILHVLLHMAHWCGACWRRLEHHLRPAQSDCLVERAVNGALSSAFDEAEALLISRFKDVTLAELSASFNAHHKGAQHAHR